MIHVYVVCKLRDMATAYLSKILAKKYIYIKVLPGHEDKEGWTVCCVWRVKCAMWCVCITLMSFYQKSEDIGHVTLFRYGYKSFLPLPLHTLMSCRQLCSTTSIIWPKTCMHAWYDMVWYGKSLSCSLASAATTQQNFCHSMNSSRSLTQLSS